jgi:hypothetical protein
VQESIQPTTLRSIECSLKNKTLYHFTHPSRSYSLNPRQYALMQTLSRNGMGKGMGNGFKRREKGFKHESILSLFGLLNSSVESG